MKKLKVYLDTSVINFLFAEDAPEFKKITEDFFERYVKKGYYDVHISEIVIEEILKTNNLSRKEMLLGVIAEYELPLVSLTIEAARLANLYIEAGIIPSRFSDDAKHIGIATVNNFDVLLSWNFKHLANVNKKNRVKILNEREGYFYPLDIVTPINLLNDDEIS